MYHLTQTQAMIMVVLVLILYLFSGSGKKKGFQYRKCDYNLVRKYPEFKEPLIIGYPLLFCQEMKKRGMVYRDRWVPKDRKNDIHDPELIKLMKEKDLILSGGQWVFTGKTREYLERKNAW